MLKSLASPDGISIAEVNTSGASGATEGAYTGVMLRTLRNPFRTYVFAGLDYGAQISIVWIDPKNLLIKCGDCQKLNGGNIKLNHWRSVAVHYEFK